MSEVGPSDMRIGDAEREDAIAKLGQHMSVGRLDVDEYGERTARATTARTRGELLALFADLPEPRPVFTQPTVPRTVGQAQVATRDSDQPLAQRVWAGLVPVSAMVALVLFLFVTRGFWPIFLLPAVIIIMGGSMWGEDWHRGRRNHRRGRPYRRGWDHR